MHKTIFNSFSLLLSVIVLSMLSPLISYFAVFLLIKQHIVDLLYHDPYNYIIIISLSFITLLILIFSYNALKIEKYFFLFYAISSISVLLSSNFISLIVSYEFMAIAGIMILALQCPNKSIITRYTLIHFLSGIILLVGICIEINKRGSTEFSNSSIYFLFSQNNGLDIQSKFFIMLALTINCAIIPFSGWLIDSYPLASQYGTIILSTFTTKVSLYLLLKLFHGSNFLIYLGSISILHAIISSIFENDIRRLLCCNLVGQIGLITIAIGTDSSISIGAVVLHIILSLIYNSLLFMCAAEIIIRTKKNFLYDIGGLFKKMPIEGLCCLIGVLATSSFPFTGTFISKSLILYSMHDSTNINILLQRYFSLSSITLFIFSGLKFFWLSFIRQPESCLIITKNSPVRQLIMLLLSTICILSAVFYKYYISIFITDSSNFNPYNLVKITINLLILSGSIILFLLLGKIFKKKINFNFNIDVIYKYFLAFILLLITNFILYINNIFIIIIKDALRKISLLTCSLTEVFYCNAIRFTVLLLMIFISAIVVFLCLSL